MSCCGKRREGLSDRTTGHTRHSTYGGFLAPQPEDEDQSVVRFQYVGRTGLTVIGAVSGKHYRFDRPGAQVVVDPRDRASLLVVPNLWEINDSATGSRSV